jgi:hypothetical protein
MNGLPMNANSTPTNAGIDLVNDALLVLRERLGIDATLVSAAPDSNDHRNDVEIDLLVDGGSRRYAVECKAFVDRRVIAQQVKLELEKVARPGLLITSYLSREIAQYCRDIDLQFIDTHGNAYLKGPGLLVYVTGERHQGGIQPGRSSAGITGVAGLRVAFVLLTNPNMAAAPYRKIASEAGVSLGAVSNAVEELERRGYVLTGKTSHRRQFVEPERLLDAWTLNYPVQLRPKLNIRRYSVPNGEWWKGEHLDGTSAVWGGEVAAEKLTHYLKASTQTIYVDPSARSEWLKTFVGTHRAKSDPNGSLEVLDKFWGNGSEQRPGVAPLALVYADLMASLDPRAAEAAQLIRKDWMNG